MNLWCDCVGSDDERASILEMAEQEALELVTNVAGGFVCKEMFPRYLGMVAAFAMGYLGKMTDEHAPGVPLLAYSGVVAGCDVAAATARALVEEVMATKVGRC